MSDTLTGLHHITAIAGDPQRTLDFYTQLLGLRLVKLTVNFDDPETYHFYFANGVGSPGTILTFFPIPAAPRGRLGSGQATALAFSVPIAALDFWRIRLAKAHVPTTDEPDRFGDFVLRFPDPDGLPIELVATADAALDLAWADGGLPVEYAVRGFHSVTMQIARPERSVALLTDTLGFRTVHSHDRRTRYAIGAGGPGTIVDIVATPNEPLGQVAAGSIHHIAWRTPDDESQLRWQSTLARLGYQVTPIVDRQYFHSIYFREPGHVLFEIATDPPGFATDESIETLGTALKLPAQYEPIRAELERALPVLTLPGHTV